MQITESLPVDLWPIDTVRPFPDNPRKITDSAVAKLAAVIEEFGWRQPIVVDEDGVILAGHTRLRAAERLKLKQVPVHVARGLTPEQAAAYRLADNRTGEETSWNLGSLAANLKALQDSGFNMKLTAFDPVELPGNVPEFEPISAEAVKPLDRKAEVKCPACGETFEPPSR